MKIQGSDVKTSADVGGGNESRLPNDTKFYITANSINQTLNAAITGGSFGGSGGFAVTTTTATDSVSVSTTTNTIYKHNAASFVYYNLPTPSAGLQFQFVNESSFSADGTSLVVTTSSNDKVYFTSNVTAKTATLSAGTYNASSLATQIASAMGTADGTNTYTVTFDVPSRKFTVARATGANTFFFTFSTNTTNTARKLFGFPGTDGSAGTTFTGNPIVNDMRIAPAAGHKIRIGNNVVENPGYISIPRRGASITLIAEDTTTWFVVDNITPAHRKNTSIGLSDRGYSLYGRNTWVSKTADSTTRQQQAGFDLNNFGYQLGGNANGGAFLSSLTQYNDSQNSWTTKAAVTSGNSRWYNTSATSLNGYGWSITGQNSAATQSTNFQYNDYVNSWTTKSNAPTALENTAQVQTNGYIYIIAGDNNAGTDLSSLTRYNDAADSYATKATISSIRQNFAADVLNSYIYVTTGLSGATPRVSTNEQYNDSADVWITKTPYPVIINSFYGSFVANGYYTMAGGNLSGGNTSASYSYNDSLNQWLQNGNLGATASGNNKKDFAMSGYGYTADENYNASVSSSLFQYN